MTTVLLRLDGPLQSWGTDSRYDVRATRPEPTKSGVIGLVAAALARAREDDVSDLAALRFGVRTERAGRIVRDYHTAQNIIPASGGKPDRSVVSKRFYLADASFLAALEGDQTVVARIHRALAAPAVPLTLGRRSCPPTLPVYVPDGMDERPLEKLLATWPLPPASLGGTVNGQEQLRVAIETDLDSADHTQPDQPVGHAYRDRTFTLRGVRVKHVPAPAPASGTSR